MKICIFLTTAICLIFYSISAPNNPNLEDLGIGEYCIYSTDIVSSPLITKTTDLGFSYIYHCLSTRATEIRKLFNTINGESITINTLSINKVLQKLKYRSVSQSKLDNTVITYAYSPRGKSYITDNGKKINLQIAQTKNTLTVGWPVILGGY